MRGKQTKMKKIRGIVKLIGQENKSIYLVTADKKTTTAYSPSEKSREFVKDSLIGKRVEITAHDDSREFTFIRITSDQTKGKDTDRLVIEPVKQPDDGELEDIATPPNEVEVEEVTEDKPIPEVEKVTHTEDHITTHKSKIDPKHIINLKGKEFITHGGLLDIAHSMGLISIMTELIPPIDKTIIFKAVVTMNRKDGGKRFTAHGDANDENVNSQIKIHKIRMAETRAINRALRLATNIGMCSTDELKDE